MIVKTFMADNLKVFVIMETLPGERRYWIGRGTEDCKVYTLQCD
jgi:hypothetical protein